MTADILIIDDDTRLTAMLEDYLKKQGFATRASATGKDGLAEIARTPPAVVILDLMLPALDGSLDRVLSQVADAFGTRTARRVALEFEYPGYPLR